MSVIVTRFAPSPTGALHLGNARTALFNWLLARQAGGRFVLRIEDTDTERSTEPSAAAIEDDLRWLGLGWDEGPDVGGPAAPYRQSQRAASYAQHFDALARAGRTYPCFCTQLELDLARRAQVAAGRPPRYAGTCRDVTPEERARRIAAGARPTTRFHVPAGRRIEFDDFVHGPQRFESDDIGDFIVRRADGSAAFFFCNAVDDAAMRVTHVLRGEDHLTNTPRQLLILEALGLTAPAYGHVALLVGDDGSPLSKRHGATSVRDLRDRGYLPKAIVNHLFRLGHSSPENGSIALDAMSRAFDRAHLGRAPARFDTVQLDHWQKDAAHHLTHDEARAWLGPALPPSLDADGAAHFLAAVLPNVTLPDDVRTWTDVVLGEPPTLDAADEPTVREAGAEFFAIAARTAASAPNDLAAIVAAVKSATGRKGPALFMPLRLALTGRRHGPELAPLLRAMPAAKIEQRLARFAN